MGFFLFLSLGVLFIFHMFSDRKSQSKMYAFDKNEAKKLFISPEQLDVLLVTHKFSLYGKSMRQKITTLLSIQQTKLLP